MSDFVALAPLLTANWEIPANSFWQVTRFRHVNVWNAASFDKNVVTFSIALRSYQFVIETWRDGACSRQRNYVRDLCCLVVGRRRARCRDKPSFRLLPILGLLKSLLGAALDVFRRYVFIARINYSGGKVRIAATIPSTAKRRSSCGMFFSA